MRDYTSYFRKATRTDSSPNGFEPYPYQIRFAEEPELPELLNVPTGVGKTATVVLGWLYRRRQHPDHTVRNLTPRRLVYCLPMRTLVEQTHDCAKLWIRNLEEANLLTTDEKSRVHVHVLMGGADAAAWDEHPERDAILIGTQDMLLSRALNRGYGMSRYRWPMHFGLLNNDCLWVMDETQLLGVGLTTTAQLQGLRQKLSTFGRSKSLWMSATLDSEALTTVDFTLSTASHARLGLSEEDQANEEVRRRVQAAKSLATATTSLRRVNENTYANELAVEVIKSHRPGSLTLAVLNNVGRTQAVFQALQKQLTNNLETPPELALIHARFRPLDRRGYERQLFGEDESRKHLDMPPGGRIVVATQTIEAGVDVSAATMFTELAPWPSLVQRFGRCNRDGRCGQDAANPPARVYWIDLETADASNKPHDKFTLPYDVMELDRARELLKTTSDAGPVTLATVTYEPRQAIVHTLRRKDLLELWDTTPDLSGNDLDVSRFIRDGDDYDVQFYWRAWDGEKPPNPKDDAGNLVFPPPFRDELCAVRIGSAKEFIKKLKTQSAWAWDHLDQTWKAVAPDNVRSGSILLLNVAAGGYEPEIGWTGDIKPKHPVPELLHLETIDPARESIANSDDAESSADLPVKLQTHLEDVEREIEKMQSDELFAVSFPEIDWDILKTAARWHDVGKSHPAFQNMLLDGMVDVDRSQLWAKSAAAAGRPKYWVFDTDAKGENNATSDDDTEDATPEKINRSGFRHELASAIAWLIHHRDEPSAELIAYLIAAHHGKVRASIRSLPNERGPKKQDNDRRFARGIWDGDTLPAFPPLLPQETKLDLSLMELGDGPLGPSWLARIVALRDDQHLGPFRLAFLETLLRVADWRGSQFRSTAK